mmetsp:Transcript_83129/g.243733  ORF Transcript_83129/g.243733 Transcript_83129/m.243733 type:complete len:231 (+) Transcript_83129:1117-1809(+)
MSRASPVRTSAASWSSDLASPRPNSAVSTLCSHSMPSTTAGDLLMSPSTLPRSNWVPWVRSPAASAFCLSCHSKWYIRPGMFLSTMTNCLWSTGKWCFVDFLPRCLSFMRCSSSWRRELTPSWMLSAQRATPLLVDMGKTSLSLCASIDSMEERFLSAGLIQLWSIAAAAWSRCFSAFFSMLLTKSSHADPTPLSFGVFFRTSNSSWKGKLPDSSPKTQIPTAQTSTFMP